MNRILLLIVLPFAFLSALSAQITQKKTDEIVLERMNEETRPHTVYAKAEMQDSAIITTSTEEVIELSYACWMYYIQYTDTEQGFYLIVNANNGNLLEINTKNNAEPNDLAEWRKVDIKDLIASNLLKTGTADTALLIGKWDVVKFAYTANGNEISDITAISKAMLTIPFAVTPVENNLEDRWRLYCVNSIWFVSSLSGNLIELAMRGSTFVNVPDDHEENYIVLALINAYSFVIIDDELIIYFTGIEGKNLLILKKQ